MNIQNIVFEGSGVKSISYIGALRALEELNLLNSLKRVGGVSSGSIAAAFIAAGFNSDEIQHIFLSAHLKDFRRGNFILNTIRLYRTYGFYNSDRLVEWISSILERKGYKKGISLVDFNKISKYKLSVVVSNVSKGIPIVVDSQSELGHLALVDIIRMSISVPVIFSSVKYEGDIYCDGGVFLNYPIRIFDFDSTSPTLGFKLSPNKNVYGNVTNFLTYTFRIVFGMHNRLQNLYLTQEDWNRTIKIENISVPSLNFFVTREDKLRLIECGYTNTKTFLTLKKI